MGGEIGIENGSRKDRGIPIERDRLMGETTGEDQIRTDTNRNQITHWMVQRPTGGNPSDILLKHLNQLINEREIRERVRSKFKDKNIGEVYIALLTYSITIEELLRILLEKSLKEAKTKPL